MCGTLSFTHLPAIETIKGLGQLWVGFSYSLKAGADTRPEFQGYDC